MFVFSNVIKPQGLEPLQFPTKFRSHSPVDRVGVEWREPQRTQLMRLSPGTRLGHYDVTALLGERGMGRGAWTSELFCQAFFA